MRILGVKKNSLIRPGIALLLALAALMPAVTSVQALPPETSYAGTDSGLTGDDYVGGPYDIGFNFTYYGNTYTQFQLTTNGLLCFNGGATYQYTESPIPSAATPNNCIYAFWDDLYSYSINTQPLLYRTIGDPGSRELIAQWTNYGYYNSSLPMGTFQVILYEGSNQIRMQYRQLLTAERSLGQSAGIGVENANGTVAVQFSLDTASLTPEQSILWTWNGLNNYTYNAGAAYEGVYLYKDNPPPGVPNLVSPGNGAAGVSTSPTFTWEAATGATTYSLRVSVNSNLSSPIISVDGLTGLSYAGSGLSVGPTYYWGIQAHNAYGDTWSTIWHFTTAAGNSAPTDITLSNDTIASGQPINTVVGALTTTDPDVGNTFTYSLVAGAGSGDNASFNISGASLRTSAVLAGGSYGVRIRSTDQGGLYVDEAFTITVTSSNSAPTDITLSNASVAENLAANTVVGAFTTTDPDAGDTFTYTLVPGAGDSGNGSFIISGSNLRTIVVFDYEAQTTYSIRVRTTDQGGLWTEQVFTITVTDVVENTTTTITSDLPDPTFVGQSYTVSVTVAPSAGAGTPTGTVSVSDGTGGTCSITLSGGSGSCDLTSTTSGAKTVTASYGGDPSWNTSSRTTDHTVNQYTPTVTITSDLPDPTYIGQTYTVAATVSGAGPTPTGTVAVNDGHGVTCTITLSGGSGNCDLTSMVTGSTTLTGTYSGNAYYSGASDTETHLVNYYAPTITITSDVPDPSVTGQSYLIAVTVYGSGPTPTGTVDLSDGNGGTCGITLVAGSGSCSLTSTVSGAMTLTAIYSGDTYYEPGSDTAGHQVNQADTSLTILSDDDDPSGPGQNFTVTWSVVVDAPGAGTPTGDVTVTDDLEAVSCSAAVAAGSCVLSLSTDGAHTLTASYPGDADFNASSDTEAHFLDATGAQVINVDSVAGTGGGSLAEDEVTNVLITQFTIEFDEDMLDPAGDSDPHDVTNPVNYQLRLNGTTNVIINSVTYSNAGGSFIATLDVNNGNYLSEGLYTLTAISDGLQDVLGNALEGGSEPGTDFVRSFEIDHTGPQVTAIMVNGRVLTSPAWAFLNTREMIIEFDEEVFDPGGSFGQDDITNPNNFLMVMAGSDHVFNTMSCDMGRAGDDIEFFVDQVTYDPETLQATLHFYTDFIRGSYHLFICGTTSIVDLVGNPLNSMIDLGNPAADFLLDISFRDAGALPATGFAPGRVTILPLQSLEYTAVEGLTLEIPSFGRSMPILEVPLTASGWDLTWLWNQAGLLEGTALPTWDGNSVLTGHIYLSNGQPGPFYGLTGLHWGDEIIIHAWGQDYVYEVRSVRQILPTAINQVLTHETQSWISLLTCQGYNQTTGTYSYRTLVRAVLIEVR